MNSVMQGLLAAANRDPRLTRVFSTYTASNPSIYLEHRPREGAGAGAQHERCVQRPAGHAGRLSTSTISTCSDGSGRSTSRATPADRSDMSSLWQIYIRNKFGTDVPLRSIAHARHHRRAAGHHPLQQLPRDPDPGQRRRRASRRAPRWRRWREVSAKTLPAGYGYEWTGTAYQEVRRPRGRPARSSASRCCSRFCSWSGFTKAG